MASASTRNPEALLKNLLCTLFAEIALIQRTGMKPAEKLVCIRYGSMFFYFLKKKKTQLAFLAVRKLDKRSRAFKHPSAKFLNAELKHD
jgi:hypothetical protein